MNPILQSRRPSYMEYGTLYFWTATINAWKYLLEDDAYKDIIIASLDYLSIKGCIDVFAFVVMPNHLHLIWRAVEPNGKESPQGSFLKYTAHCFEERLRQQDARRLAAYRVEASNKHYEFWQRDPLAISLFTREVALQKLNYLHNNPLAKHWTLVKDPGDYKYSSAQYYERKVKNFPFLKDLWEVV